jgi:PAS domain S-box-containing protein
VTKSQSKKVVCPFLDPENFAADGTKCAILQHIISTMPDTIFYRRNLVSGTYEYVSPSCEQLLGVSAEELGKMTLKEALQQLIHPDDHLHLQEAMTHLIRTNDNRENKSLDIEYRLKCRNGKYRWVNETLAVRVDENGVPSAIIGYARDIDEKVQLRNALHLSQQRFKNLYDNARIALFRSTIKGDHLMECNNLFAWTMGFRSPAECTNDFCFASNSVNSVEYEKLVSDICDSKVVNKREIQIRRKDGSACWLSITAFWLDDESFGGSALDITSTKDLSETEVSILKLLLAGLSNKEIATRLNRSRRTVEQHRASIMKKLNAQNLVDLATHYLSVVF